MKRDVNIQNAIIKNHKKKASLLSRKISSRKSGQLRNPRSTYGYLLYNKKNEDLIGINYYEYVIYLEKNNKHNLEFAKYEFDIDHILPLARSLTPQEYLSRWNYQNTCMEDLDINRKKANSYDHEYAIRKIILRDKYINYIRKEKQIKVFDEFYSYEQLNYILSYSTNFIRFEYFLRGIYSMEHIGAVKNNCINFSFNNEPFIETPNFVNNLRGSGKSFDIYFNLRKFLFIVKPIEYFNHRQTLIDLVDEPKKIFQKLAAEYDLIKNEKIDNKVTKIIEKFLNEINNKKNDFIELEKIIKAYIKEPIKEKKFLKLIKKLQSKSTYKVGELKPFNELASDTKSKVILTEISDGLNYTKVIIEDLKNDFKIGIYTEKEYAKLLVKILETNHILIESKETITYMHELLNDNTITEKDFIKVIQKLAVPLSTKKHIALLKQKEKNAIKFEKQRAILKQEFKDGIWTAKEFKKEVQDLKKKILLKGGEF